jgi:hypothetical protein
MAAEFKQHYPLAHSRGLDGCGYTPGSAAIDTYVGLDYLRSRAKPDHQLNQYAPKSRLPSKLPKHTD